MILNSRCSIDSCERLVYVKGWCRGHYLRWYKYGDPLTGSETRFSSPKEAFEARTEWQGNCLVWTGSKTRGYGYMQAEGRKQRVHRWAYEQAYGSIPEGLVIDHMCHNKACCNVEHLRAVTQKQNLENQSGPPSNTSSGYRNVSWDKRYNKWLVVVGSKGKKYFGGRFSDVLLADTAAIALRNKLHSHNDKDRK